MSATSETFAFQAEINQLLSLIINAFYSNKEIFLRELICNASDAIDKIRYLSLSDKHVLEGNEKLAISVVPDVTNKTLIIEDSGIGMTKKELVENLGTIARSGTKSFMEALTDGKTDISLIGQFGVGFYSAYLVADTVRVVTKHNDDKQYTWESNAGGSFTITESDEPNLPRGTRVYLHLKPDMQEYLSSDILKDLIRKHNGYINYPINLEVEKDVEVQVDEQDNEKQAEEGDVEEVDDDTKDKTPKTVTKKVKEFEQVNVDKPVWTRNASEVTDDEYKSFYKSLTNDWADPIAWKHFSVEGSMEFKGLLYIPENPPMDMFDKKDGQKNIKLHVRRVFIMDDCKDIIPEYLSFIKGIVDSDDLPLNISREMLQQSRALRQIKKNIVKRCLDMFNDLAENKKDVYIKFYNNFHKNLKLGVHEDTTNRDKLLELLRFRTSKTTNRDTSNENDLISLSEYVSRAKEGQKSIYYLTGESLNAVKTSPLLEAISKKGYEVLFMIDPMDEYMMQQLHEYKDFKFVCCSKDMDIPADDDEKEATKKLEEEYKDVCEYLKKTIGTDNVTRVQISTRLVDTPCVVVSDKFGWTANMERIMNAQALGGNNQMAGFMRSRKVLEINPDHKFIKYIKANLAEDTPLVKNLAKTMFDAAMLHSGFTIAEPDAFVKRLYRMIGSNLFDEVNDENNNENDSTEILDEIDDTKDASLTELVSSMEQVD